VLGVLELLVVRAGDVVSRQELIDNVWNEAFVTDTSLAEAVSFLRQSLGDDPQAPTYIQTIHRRGYRFVAPVIEASSVPARAAIAVPDAAPRPEPPLSPSIGGVLLPWSAAALFALLAAAALWQFTHLSAPNPPVVRVRLDPSPGTTFDPRSLTVALSPDATAVVWPACDASACRLYLRDLDRLEAQAVAGTEEASDPFFSPDGRWIGFFAGGKLRKVARAGGLPIALADAAQSFGAAWLDDGHLVFATSAHGGLLRVSDRGGEVETMTTPAVADGEIGHGWPSVAPGGGALLFAVATSPVGGSPARIAIMPLGPGAPRTWRTAIDAADAARAVAGDHLAFSRGGELHAVAFDRIRLAPVGAEIVAIGERVSSGFSTSAGGALAYLEQPAATQPALEWWSAGGPSIVASLATLREPSLSPDAKQVAGIEGDQASTDIRIADLARGATSRLTHGGVNVGPVWSGDGAAVFYASSRGGPFEVRVRDGSAAAPAKLVLSAADRQRHVFPASASRDGRLLAYDETGGPTRGDIGIMPLPAGTAQRIVETPFDEMNGTLSPDGRMLAYQSDESGRFEIYLMKIADKRRLGISSGGGTNPFWSSDGRTLHYRAADRLVSMAVDAAGDRLGTPVFSAPLSGAVPAGIAPDGPILLRRGGTGHADHAVLTLEWIREVRRLLGPPAAALPR
jgi:serine/threonine-protein kinase